MHIFIPVTSALLVLFDLITFPHGEKECPHPSFEIIRLAFPVQSD